MFETLIANNQNLQQAGFSIVPFKNKAQLLSGQHRVVIDTIEFLETNNIENVINRPQLTEIWNNLAIPIYIKIIITFWWGNLSHKDQAPLFYRENNLTRILNFSKELGKVLNGINEQEDAFEYNLNDLYNALKLNIGKFKMSGINTAFFTKILQFGITSTIQPIIADKWSIRAVLADMIDQNFHYKNIFRISQNNGGLSINFRGSANNEFEKYFLMIIYFNNRCSELQIDPRSLEEIMFGYGNAMHDYNNPRLIAQNIILQEYNN